MIVQSTRNLRLTYLGNNILVELNASSIVVACCTSVLASAVKGVLEMPEGQEVIVIGTLYKDMKLKPSILAEYSKVGQATDNAETSRV